MRIIIAGPMPDERKSGGVAVFDKNLALQLASDKHNEVLIATNKPKFINKKDEYPQNVSFTKVQNVLRLKSFNAEIGRAHV